MSRHIGRRRLARFTPPPAVLYARAAEIRRRADELGWERRSRRIRQIGVDIATALETIADDQVDQRRAA
jgi:hypothetical protein